MEKEHVTERVVESPVVVERKSGGLGVILGIILVGIAAVAVYFIATDSRNNSREATAITGAAESVGDAARQVGDAAQDASQQQQRDNTQ